MMVRSRRMKNIREKKGFSVKHTTALLALILTIACATSDGPYETGPGTQQMTPFAVFHKGPEIAIVVVHPSGERSVGEEWLVLGMEWTATQGSGPALIGRDDISLRTPNGRRLAPTDQNEFRRNFPRLQIPIERILANLPLLHLYTSYLPRQSTMCSRWFFVGPPGDIAFDEIQLSSTQGCFGPMIFQVPGGVQPGRWRLTIELEESRADIPFFLELED